jgi:hypothetical protein
VTVAVSTNPLNSYEYTDARGDQRSVHLPPGVRIVSSVTPITFRPNGSVLGGATTVIETELSSSRTERWSVQTNGLGISRASKVIP